MKFDWLEGTILGKGIHSALHGLRELFPDWQELDHGGLGYECSAIAFGTGRVYWSRVRPENGVHVSLPPSAIALSTSDYPSYARTLNDWGTKFTRLDLAEDDTKGLLDLEIICKAVESGHYVSRAKKKTKQIIDYESVGRTFYFGREQSKTRIRIYDKAAEQRSAGKEYVGHWVRVEMQLRDERANGAVVYILDHPDDWQKQACGWLLAALDFKTVGTDSNKSRWKTAEWWLTFLDSASKSRIFISRNVQTIETVVDWLGRQVAPSLFVLQTVYGSDSLSDMAKSGAGRLKHKHIAMIDLARAYHVPIAATGAERESLPSD